MRREVREELDEIERKERARKWLSFLGACLLLGSIVFILQVYHFSPGEKTEISGIVTGLVGVPRPKQGEAIYFVVLLQDGNRVKVKKPNGVPFLKNKKVKLVRISDTILGNIRYSFQGYIEEKNIQ